MTASLTTVATATWRMRADQFIAVCHRAHSDTVPGALRLPREHHVNDADLRAAGLSDDYGVDPHLETVLRLAATAPTEISVMLLDSRAEVTADGGSVGVPRPQRAVVAIGHSEAALIAVTGVGADGDGRDVVVQQLAGNGMDCAAAAVWGVLGEWPAGDVISVRFVLETLQQRLALCRSTSELAVQLRALGCEESHAQAVASALAAPRRAEIVARVQVNGITQTSIGAVAVFDGAAGRMVAVPSASTDGVAWTTFSAGTRTRLEQALRQLVSAIPVRAGRDVAGEAS